MRKRRQFLLLPILFLILTGCNPVLTFFSSVPALIIPVVLTSLLLAGCVFRISSSSIRSHEAPESEVLPISPTTEPTATPLPTLTPNIPTLSEIPKTFAITETEVVSTITVTPIPLSFYNAARVGKKIMLSFDSPAKILTPFMVNVSVNGVDISDFEYGLYDSNRPGRIFLIGLWRPKDAIKVVIITNGSTYYYGEIFIPTPLEPIATSVSTSEEDKGGEGGDTTGGPITGETTGNTDE